jgi:hypothetical protein
MNGQSGNEEPWYWDSLDAENDYVYFRAASDFVTLSGLADQSGLAKSTPVVTGGALGPLSFAPGGGWGTATQSLFTVGNAAPDGFATAPSYLQGQYHASMTPGGYTFAVNYPQAGTFSVQVLEVASSGAGLVFTLDGVTQTNITFPAEGADTTTNFTATIPVSAGAHSINLGNPGLDWILLGNITLAPYVSDLAAYAVGNSGFNATWVWSQENVFNPNATATESGTVQVAGLGPGNYSAVWWDTFAGAPLTNFAFTVASSNTPATLNTPAILRSAALYVGTPPQAGVIATGLTQTLGTNSPLLTEPVEITNSGGLPLGYTLAVTNATPLVYAAINSTQPAGPAFVWKDISGVGQDISGTFTALAPPKTAQDEGIAGPVNLGFSFPFFSNSYSQLYISPNGFAAFSPFQGDTSTNTSFPNAAGPSNAIAFFWQDLNLGASGHVYTCADPMSGTFTVEFQNVPLKGQTASVTCQLILKATGEILLEYLSPGSSNACTVGVQYAAAAQGTTVAFKQNYLRSNFAVLLTPTPWLRFDATAGFVPGAGSNTVNLSLNPAGLSFGNYSATVLVQTTDPKQPLFSLPVSLALTSLATWRQTYFGAPQNSGNAANNANPSGDGIANLLAYAYGLNPLASNPPPLSVLQITNHLAVLFTRPHPAPPDIAYLPQVTGAVNSGVWNSGPPYIFQVVTNNGNGTETVIATDLTPISAAPSQFLQILIEPQ